MPRTSRHKSHKQSKHTSKDHSDSEDGSERIKERSGKYEGSNTAHGDSTSGEKRKTSSQLREDRERKDSSVHVNGEASEEYVSSKRRKGKADAFGDGDRWNGGGDGKDNSDNRAFEKKMDKGNSMKADVKHKESGSKGESLKLEHKSKSKRNERGVPGDRMEDSSALVVVEKEEKSRSVSKRKSEKDSSVSKDGRDSKDKDRRSEKERNVGHGSKNSDGDVKMVDCNTGKKQASTSGEERQSKRSREETGNISKNVLQSPVLEKEFDKRARRKREGSSEREKHPDDSRDGDERRVPSKADHQKDDKYKDREHAAKGLEDSHRNERRRDENYIEESDKDYRYYDEKCREDGEKYAKRQDYRYQEDGERDTRQRDERYRWDGERETKRKDDKYREGLEDRRDDKYQEDVDRNSRCKDDRYHEDGEKDIRRGHDRYVEDGGRDDKHRNDGYRDGGEREYRHKDEKYRDDSERDVKHNTNMGDEIDREKRQREIKYDHDIKDRLGDRSDIKRSGHDIHPADGHARKSSAYDESSNHDYRTSRYKDDQNRKRTNEKEDYGESKSRSTKDQRSDSGKRSGKLDPASDKMRTSSRNADSGHTGHSKRRGSPSSSSHGPRDNHRSQKQDESKYRDYNADERPREHANSLERSEKTASRSLEKHALNDYSQLREVSAERHLKSDNHSSPLQRTGGSRDWKAGRGSRELGLDAAPVEERTQDDDNALLISSPSMKNNNLSSSLRSLPPPPPPFRSGGSPLPMGSVDDDSRSRSHNHHRRIGDPNMGRIQGNIWRGVPTWTSPVPNGFLPFPAPPPVGFHPVMQPFPAPPMFGVQSSMDLNMHPSYQMPDSDRYFGTMRPMGWQNQVDDTCPPMQTWDANGAVFGDESYIYGRPDWNQSQNTAIRNAWGESTDDARKGVNNDKSLEALSVGKENTSLRGADEGSQSQADSTEIHLSAKITEKNNAAAGLNGVVDKDGFIENEMTKPVCFSIAYLSRLDVSEDLAEPELFSKFAGLMTMDQNTISDVDDSKILYSEDLGTKISSISSPNSALYPSIDESVFQRSIALYQKQKQTLQPNDIAGLELNDSDPKSDLYSTDTKSANLRLANNAHVSQDGVTNTPTELEPFQHAVDSPKTKDAEMDSEMQPSSDASSEGIICASHPGAKDDECGMVGSDKEEVKLVGTAEFGALVNSDVVVVVSEANMPAASLGLSRIHRSPESTH